MKNNFKPLASILQKVVHNNHLEDEYKLHLLQQEWQDIVGPQITNNAKPYSIEGKGLTLEVQSIEWKEEIRKDSSEIIKKINNYSDDFKIEYINII